MEIRSVTVLGTGPHAGRFFVGLAPFDDTSNSGGEYKVVVSTDPQLANGSCTKSDNFKVVGHGSVKVTKDIDGGPADFDATFDFTLDCDVAGSSDFSITTDGGSGSHTSSGIVAGNVCTLTEGDLPAPPAGYTWGEPTITGSPATVTADTTKTIAGVNHLNLIPPPPTGSLKITKSIPDVPEGYEGSFGVHVTCDEGGPFDATIDFPDPGFVTIDDIPAGATCVVIETTKSAPPAGFQFGGANINGPVTIGAGQTAEITVTNPLIELQGTPVLTIDKSNDAPTAAAGGSKPGDTVTYTLDYTVANGPVHNGIITDVLPAGLTYVSGSASSDAQFTFIDFNVTTPGALTWKAATVSANGSLTYKVTVDADAADEDQPLTNTATIDSDETAPSSDKSDVFVPAPVAAETSVPTAPRSHIVSGSENTTSGSSMLLILLALAGIALAVVFVAPTPAAIRKRKDH